LWADGVQRADEVVEQLVQSPVTAFALVSTRDLFVARRTRADLRPRPAGVSCKRIVRRSDACVCGHDAVGFEAIDVSHQRGPPMSESRATSV
jgi:hypothetical protein